MSKLIRTVWNTIKTALEIEEKVVKRKLKSDTEGSYFIFSNLQEIALMHWVVTQLIVLHYVTQGTYCLIKQHDRTIRNMGLEKKQQNTCKDNLRTLSAFHAHSPNHHKY